MVPRLSSQARILVPKHQGQLHCNLEIKQSLFYKVHTTHTVKPTPITSGPKKFAWYTQVRGTNHTSIECAQTMHRQVQYIRTRYVYPP